jgi:hypothetical protein
MYEMAFENLNVTAVFGVALGIYLILHIDIVLKNVVTFVKGWRTNQ